MTDTTPSAPAPKKRSLFKRAAWQDAPKTEGEDMFSHANEFQNIVAEQKKLQAEEKTKAEEARKRKHANPTDRKRRKVSDAHDEPGLAGSGSGSSSRAKRTGSKARSRTPASPAASRAPPDSDSLSARYDTLTQASSSDQLSRKEPVVVDLGDSDDENGCHNDNDNGNDDSGYQWKSFGGNSTLGHAQYTNERTRDVAVRPAIRISDDEDDDLEEALDPALAALAARARERAAKRAQAASASTTDGEAQKAPVVQLFISPEIPDAKPLMVRVRTDHTLEKTRQAWCGRQQYSPEMTRSVFFTWKGTRVYDSTTIKRLGIQVDANGNVSVEGDANLYDDVNLPKVYVEAWTDELFQQHKRTEAAEAAARKKAAEPPPVVEEREPTPEPAPKVKKIRLIMKAKGREDFKLSVNPESTFGHIANAYKTGRDIEQSQPITLMFDGDRLVPMDSIADSEVEDMDSIDVLFK